MQTIVCPHQLVIVLDDRVPDGTNPFKGADLNWALSSLSVMGLASPLGSRGFPVSFLTNLTFPSDLTARRYRRLQMNRVAAAFPALRTERDVVSVHKVAIGRWTGVHSCWQVQLLFEACSWVLPSAYDCAARSPGSRAPPPSLGISDSMFVFAWLGGSRSLRPSSLS